MTVAILEEGKHLMPELPTCDLRMASSDIVAHDSVWMVVNTCSYITLSNLTDNEESEVGLGK